LRRGATRAGPRPRQARRGDGRRPRQQRRGQPRQTTPGFVREARSPVRHCESERGSYCLRDGTECGDGGWRGDRAPAADARRYSGSSGLRSREQAVMMRNVATHRDSDHVPICRPAQVVFRKFSSTRWLETDAWIQDFDLLAPTPPPPPHPMERPLARCASSGAAPAPQGRHAETVDPNATAAAVAKTAPWRSESCRLNHGRTDGDSRRTGPSSCSNHVSRHDDPADGRRNAEDGELERRWRLPPSPTLGLALPRVSTSPAPALWQLLMNFAALNLTSPLPFPRPGPPPVSSPPSSPSPASPPHPLRSASRPRSSSRTPSANTGTPPTIPIVAYKRAARPA